MRSEKEIRNILEVVKDFDSPLSKHVEWIEGDSGHEMLLETLEWVLGVEKNNLLADYIKYVDEEEAHDPNADNQVVDGFGEKPLKS